MSEENNRSMYLSIAISILCVILYLMILTGFPYLGDRIEFKPDPIIPILAASGYLAGGALIYFKNKRLILLGLIFNPLVIVLYFVTNWPNIEVYGIIIKIAQLILEYLLWDIYRSLD